jgi:hypothetical protein
MTGSVHRNPPAAATQAYPPSVPLSVYRELGAELQAAQAMLDQLTAINQQLAQENQLLRQEIAKVVETVTNVQKLVNSHTSASYQQNSHSPANLRNNTKRRVTKAYPNQRVSPKPSRVVSPIIESSNPAPQPVYIEEQEVSYYPGDEPETTQINGWWFMIAILIIILMGFGAGYLIVRPLFESQSR